MDLPTPPLKALLERLPAVAADESIAAFDRLSLLLTQEFEQRTVDAPALFSAAYEAIQRLPPDFNSPSVVHCLQRIAGYYYLSATPLLGVEPAALCVERARRLSDPVLLCKALKLLGLLRAETGNLPEASKACNEGIDVARAAKNSLLEAELWINLGLAQQYAAQYGDAAACFDRVLALSDNDPSLKALRKLAFTNIAVTSLHLNEVKRGLKAAKQAVDESGEPNDAESLWQRVMLENFYTRLLLEVDAVLDAKKHAKLARKYATESKSELCELAAEIAESLVDVHSSRTDIGLTRLKRALQRSRNGRTGALQDVLYATISGYEYAGQHDIALSYLHEALRIKGNIKTEQVLNSHLRHLSRVDRSIDTTADNAAQKHHNALRGKLDRELLKSQIAELEQATVAAELHDDTTGEHVYRVGLLTSLLGKEIGLEEEICFLLLLGARMHDIGKLSIPDSILLKPGKLTPAEFDIIKTHTTYGATLLSQSKIPQMHIAEEIARGHHEKWDGSGYPNGLKGMDIPLAARLAALADVFDALSHARCYKPAWSIEASLEEIERGRGSHFDPELTDAFVGLVRRLNLEHPNLDAFLAQDAKSSDYIQTRREIAAKLKGPDGHAIFDLRR
jgi:putative two-component system response regulator